MDNSSFTPDECGPGWHSIIEPLIKLCNEKGVQIAQIKEKFGSLRFYVEQAPDEVHEAINVAEELSCKTCEVCGEPGLPRDLAWIKTLCEAHYEERKREKIRGSGGGTAEGAEREPPQQG